MRVDDFVTYQSPAHPGRILVASRTCACRAIVGKFTACPSHANNIELEQAFLKRAGEEQDNYDKGIIRAVPSDRHDEAPKTPSTTPDMVHGGTDPWDT